MNSELPKVLHPLFGKPLIKHVIEHLKGAGIDDIIVVVGYMGESVINAVGSSVEYVWQHEQLGTGHAVMQAEKTLEGFQGSVVLACGDVPLIRSVTFQRLIMESKKVGIKSSVLTMKLDNPTGYGRIVTDQNDNFIRIVEEKDTTLKEKRINEVNTGTYVFDKVLLFSGLETINIKNAQGEYYLPDALEYIRLSGGKVRKVLLEDSIEGSGINSKDDLQNLENYYKKTKL